MSEYTTAKNKKIIPLTLLSKFSKNKKLINNLDMVNISLPNCTPSSKQRYATEADQQHNENQMVTFSLKKQKQNHKQSLVLLKQIKPSQKSPTTIQKSQSSKFRYYSVQKQSLSRSPYKTPQRIRLQSQKVQSSKLIFEKIKKNAQARKNNMQKDKFPQLSSKKLENVGTQQLNSQFQAYEDLVIHYIKFHAIQANLAFKKEFEKLLIDRIRDYVLQECDISQVQSIYQKSNTGHNIRKIILWQRIVILNIVFLLITHKYPSYLQHIKTIFEDLLKFYGKIFYDINTLISSIKEQDQINASDSSSSSFKRLSIKEQKQIVAKIAKKYQPSNKTTQVQFNQIATSLENNAKFLLKMCKPFQLFCKIQFKNLVTYTPNLLYYKLLEFFSFFLLGQNCLGWNIEFLQTCPSPYLHFQPEKPYTLVLDMDETLIHYKITSNKTGQFLLRPHLFQFLENLSQHYEIGIFTCGMPQYADLILNNLKHLSFRLYRHHTVQISGQYTKDLSRLGRDLKKTIIVDNLNKNFQLQKQNGIHVKSWYGDRKDNILMRIQKQLLKIVKEKVQDIRESQHCRSFF